MRDRAILEMELAIVRRQIEVLDAVKRGEMERPFFARLDLGELQACETTLVWLLNGVPAPGPITGDGTSNPLDRGHVRTERNYAEGLAAHDYDPRVGPPVSRQAAETNVRAYAQAVALTLDWATDSSNSPEWDNARGATAEDIPDEFADLVVEGSVAPSVAN